MATNMESTGQPSSLTARRPAAGNLPQMNLPLPPYNNSQFAPKYMPLPAMNANANQTTSSVSVGNLLTPPSTVPGDSLSPISQALAGAAGTQGPAQYNSYSWPPLNLNTGLTPLGLSSGTTPQPWNNPLNNAKGMFSPSLVGTLATTRNSSSPTAAESIPPPPPYDIGQLPPLPTSTSMSMSMSASSTLAGATTHQQAMAQAQAFMAQTQTQTQTPVSATTTKASPVSGADAYTQRPQSTPSAFYSQSQPSSTQQSSFPPFTNNSSPIQQSPMSAPPQTSRTPINQQGAFSPPTSQAAQFGRPQYSTYSLPAMSAPAQINAPIMSNVHNPGNPLSMMSMQSNGLPGSMIGYHSGHAAHLQQQMYGAPPQPAHNERPFKCDQCPQSFNRNHDLKRHKRIHLAVKPFPCGHCEKSFSRKDALKRHILVKGCGKGTSSGRQDSPDTRTKSEDSDDDTSPP